MEAGDRRMTWPVARAVLVTAFLCAVAGYFVLARNERKREGMPPRRPLRHRPMAPCHPDRFSMLSDEDATRWEGIEAGLLDDAGLAILDRDEPGPNYYQHPGWPP